MMKRSKNLFVRVLGCRGSRYFAVAVLFVLALSAAGAGSLEAATVSWISNSNGGWNVAGNWSSNPALPGPSDDATIDRFGVTLTITHSTAANTVLHGLTLNENLNLTAGSIQTTNLLAVGEGFAISASGANTLLNAAGTASVNGAQFKAFLGARILLPGMTSYYDSGAKQPWGKMLSADGAGSLVDASQLTNLTTNAGAGFCHVVFQATNGGQVKVGSLSGIIGGAEYFIARGQNSSIDLSALTSFQASEVSIGTRGLIEATNRGTVNIGGLATLSNVDLLSDGTGTLPTAQITSYTLGTGTISGGAPNFSSVETIDGASFIARNGGVVALDNLLLSSYTEISGANAERVLKADGAGSLLSIPYLATISLDRGKSPDLAVTATSGGTVDLSGASQILNGAVKVTASGSSSLVDLSNLTKIVVPYAHVGQTAFIQATAGGRVKAPKLAWLEWVDLNLDGTGTMDTAQIQKYKWGTLRANGFNPSLAKLTDITAASFRAFNGATISLTNTGANSYVDLTSDSFQTRYFSADGPGSLLDLSKIKTLRACTSAFAQMNIQATNAGRVNLTGLTAPDVGSGAIVITSSDSGSIVDISAMTSFTPSPQFARASSIQVRNAGEVKMANLTTLRYVDLANDGTGIMPIAQITQFSRGTFTATAGTYSFTGLANLDGASFNVSGGAKVYAPAANHYDDTSAGAFSDRTLTASGSGSLIDLSSLSALNSSNAAFTTLTIQALSGGTVSLRGITAFDTGAVQITSSGAGSLVDLSSLSSFTPHGGFGTTSGINAAAGGIVLLGNTPPPLPGMNFNASSGGIIQAANYQLTGGAVLSGDGTFSGSVQNLSKVSPGNSPGKLTISGNYVQGAAGDLWMELGGNQPGLSDMLMISGDAMLGGELDVNLLNGYVPALGDSFTLLTAGGSLSGQFSTVNLPALGSNLSWRLTPSAQALTLNVVPEPGTFALLAMAGGLLLFLRQRAAKNR